MTKPKSDRVEVPIPPDVYEVLAKEARRRGVDIDDLANLVIMQALEAESFERRVREHFERECPELIAKYGLVFGHQDSRVH